MSKHPLPSYLVRALLAALGCVALAVILQAGPALAQAAAMPPPPDLMDEGGQSEAARLLYEVFGGLVPGFDAGARTLVSEFASMANIVVQGIAAAIVGYYVVTATVRTAQHGDFLGKDWSSVWMPIRFTMAMSALVPLPSGYVLAQLLMIKLALVGAGAADWIWKATTERFVRGGLSVAAVSPPSNVATLDAALSMLICQHAANDAIAAVAARQGGDLGVYVGVDHETRRVNRAYGSDGLTLQPLERRINGGDVVTDQKLGAFVMGGVERDVWVLDASVKSTTDNSVVYRGACGSLIFDSVPAERPDLGLNAGDARANDAAQNEIAIPIREAHVAAVQALVASGGKLDTLAKEIVARSFPNRDRRQAPSEAEKEWMLQMYEQAQRDHYLTVGAAGQVALASLRADSPQTNTLVRMLGESGWVRAGTWYLRIAGLNREVYEAVSMSPSVASATLRMPTVAKESFNDRMLGAGQTWNEAKAWKYPDEDVMQGLRDGSAGRTYGDVTSARNAAEEHGVATAVAAAGAGIGSVAAAVNEGIGEFFAGAFTFGGTANGGNGWGLAGDPAARIADPLGELVHYGHRILNLLIGLMLAALVGATLFSIAGKTPMGAAAKTALKGMLPGGDGGASGFMIAFSMVMASLLIMVFGSAAFLALVLPMMPFIIWVTAITGWLILVAEGVIGAAFWALAHLQPEGEGFSGQQGAKGWFIVLNIVLRPVLMIGGMFVGIAIFTVSAGLTIELWQWGVQDALLGHSAGIVTQMILMVTLTGILVVMAERSFRLITWLPDTVVRWLGGQGERLMEESDDGRSRNVGMVAVNQGGQVGQRMAAHGGQMVQKDQQAEKAQQARAQDQAMRRQERQEDMRELASALGGSREQESAAGAEGGSGKGNRVEPSGGGKKPPAAPPRPAPGGTSG